MRAWGNNSSVKLSNLFNFGIKIYITGDKIMRTSKIIKRVAIGVTVGAAALAATSAIAQNTHKGHKLKRKAGKAIKSVGNTITDFSYVLK